MSILPATGDYVLVPRDEYEALQRKAQPEELYAVALRFIHHTWRDDGKYQAMNSTFMVLADIAVTMAEHERERGSCPFTFQGTRQVIEKQLREIAPLFNYPVSWINQNSPDNDSSARATDEGEAQ